MNRAERYRARREKRLELHAARGPILPGDVALTIGLLVVASVVLALVTTFGGTAILASAACTSDACTTTVGVAGVLGLILPLLIFLVGATVSVIRLFRHLRGWTSAVVVLVTEALCLPLAWGVAAIGAML